MKKALTAFKGVLKKIWKYRLLACLLVIGIMGWFAYSQISSFLSAKDKEMAALNLELKSTRQLKTTNRQLVQEVEQVKKVSSAQIKQASDSIFKLNKREAKLIKENTRLAIIAQTVSLGDTISAGYDTMEVYNQDEMTCDSIASLFARSIVTPAPFSYNSDSIQIAGTVRPHSVDITKVEIPDSLYERDVIKKAGLFGWGKKYATQIYHSNPMFRSNDAAVFTVPHKVTWWHRTGKPAGAAVVSGVITYFITTSIINSVK